MLERIHIMNIEIASYYRHAEVSMRSDVHQSLPSFEWDTDKWSTLLKVLREPRLAIRTAKKVFGAVKM
jgi:hypothetical protein